ncbi:DUF6314 family protein [Castellaniella sp. UC4442_H9]|jgi:hypothetical protein|nr:DUF6314 family protein [Castellaniella sp.]
MMMNFVGPSEAASQYDPVGRVWSRLPSITRLAFQASPGSASRTLWRGHGEARVDVESTPDSRRFVESGQFWPGDSATAVAVRNAYLWQRDGASLLLSHERFGRDAPVFLLRLDRVDDTTLEGGEPHQCALDQYRATLRLTASGFRLDWVITGPNKDERLSQHYTMRTTSA